MNKVLTIFTLFIALCSCSKQKNTHQSKPANLYFSPITHPLKIGKNAYQINPVTGDSIKPITDNKGNMIISGQPMVISPEMIKVDSTLRPKKFKFKAPPKKVYAHHNKIPSQKPLPVKLLMRKSSTNNQFKLMNSTGDTIPTGVPIKIKGKMTPTIQPKPKRVNAMQTKDYASENIQELSKNQGLPSSLVESIYQDTKGNIWIGTRDAGVLKYDGTYIIQYTQKEGLLSDIVYSITEDNEGNMWFACSVKGICRYDGKSFTQFTEKEGLPANSASYIKKDSKGNLWFILGNHKGVTKFDGKTFTHFTQNEGLSSNEVKNILYFERAKKLQIKISEI